MNSNPKDFCTCFPARVDSYLQENISDEDEEVLLLHLARCDSCRDRMTYSAADPDTWNEFENALADAPHDSILLSHQDCQSGIEHGELGGDATEKLVLSMLAPTDDPEMLGRLGPHEISGVIGSGGMGVVLKAHDRSLERTIAIKVLAPHLASSGAARKRFAREAKAAAAVLHPNVIAIHGVSNDAALPYLVMPYLRGESLQRRLNRLGPLSTAETLRIGQQIAAGLAAAHSQGLVHRDIKPSNIMLEDGVERLTITDFGLARACDDASMTRSGVIAGTPQYMSPEQARGEAVDPRSDLFSLGSVLYAMCTGHSPFRAETSYGVLHRITHQTPRAIREINSEVPVWMCRLIERLHHKVPNERLQTAEQVEHWLVDCIAHLEQPDKQPLPATLEDVSRGSSLRAIAFAAVALFLAAISATSHPSRDESGQKSIVTSGSPASAPVEIQSDPNGDSKHTVNSIDTDWIDPFDPTPYDVNAKAQRLELEIWQSFANGPTEHEPPNEGSKQ